MKKYRMILLAAIAVIFSGCVKDLEKEGFQAETELIGTVVEKSTNNPLPDIKVSITDGDHIHASTTTNQRGDFKLKVNYDELNNDYYLLLDGSPNMPFKQEELHGMGGKVYDYKTIVLYDKTNADLLPIITTDSVLEVASVTVKVNGTIAGDGGYVVTERGVCFATHQTPTLDDSVKSAGYGMGGFTCLITGLTPSTTYYVRAYATNSIGTVYGIQKMFVTTSGLPEVMTDAVSNITTNSAVCGGNVISDGGFAVTEKGICWSVTEYPTITDYLSDNGSGTGLFKGSMHGLNINTTYYVRAYATNSRGTAYGEQKSFTTANGLPTINTADVSRSGTAVTTGGNVTNDGGFAVTARGICYGLIQNPDLTSAHSHTIDGSGTGSFSSKFDMSKISIYYVRAYATNANGTSYGKEKAVRHPYLDLPSFSYGGRTYRMAPTATNIMSYSSANSYCNNLTLYGYSDWRLPTTEELERIYEYNLGGVRDYYCWASGGYCVYWGYNRSYVSSSTGSNYVRPVRVEK